MAIRAVVFDIGGVLERVDDDAWPETWATRWEARAGLPAGAFAERLAAHAPAGSVVTGEVTETQLAEPPTPPPSVWTRRPRTR